jgi:acetoin utilization protein AcuC
LPAVPRLAEFRRRIGGNPAAASEATMTERVLLICGEEVAAYGFPDGHPFGPDRHDAFMAEFQRSPKASHVVKQHARLASREEIEYFHTSDYVDHVIACSRDGFGSLDRGDTPAYPGVYEAAAHVVGGTLDALAAVMSGSYRKAFAPIGGLHHAARGGAAGFCVFNDAGVAIEAAFALYGLERVVYVDIDAHHGDGVFYGFEDDPRALFADIHEDGRYLYPGTGHREETGRGPAAGTKLNIPVPPGADDETFYEA